MSSERTYTFVNEFNNDGRRARRRLDEDGDRIEIPVSSDEPIAISNSSTSQPTTICVSCQQPGHLRSSSRLCRNYRPRRVATDPVSICEMERM